MNNKANKTSFKKGHKHSEESLKKISAASLGKTSPLKGKKLSPEHIEKLKTSHIGQKAWNKGMVGVTKGKKGAESAGWKGGVTPINHRIRMSVEYKLWRTSVFERDGYTCIWCGAKAVILNADHIKPFAHYPELRFAIDNGRTLCVPCHKTTDTYGGRANKNVVDVRWDILAIGQE